MIVSLTLKTYVRYGRCQIAIFREFLRNVESLPGRVVRQRKVPLFCQLKQSETGILVRSDRADEKEKAGQGNAALAGRC